MKNIIARKGLLALAAVLLTGIGAEAQVATTFAKNATPGQQNGFYYALPQTVLRLDFTIMETSSEEGPYSDYAYRYLGGADYAETDGVVYELLGVNMVRETNADPDATFFVSFAMGRGMVPVDIDVTEEGIVRSIGAGNGVEAGCPTAPAPSVAAQVPQPAAADGFPLVMAAGKSDEQIAKGIADRLEEIEKARFQLCSGFYEVAYDDATLSRMLDELDAMEKGYRSLLLGKVTQRVFVQSVYVIPNKDIATMSVAKFSATEGLTAGTGGSGSIISVQTLPLNTVANINAPSRSAIESMTYDGKVFYRVPDMANVKVSFMGKVLLEERVSVNQFGVLLMAPVANSRLVFNTETGQVSGFKLR